MTAKRVLVFGMTPNPGGMESVVMNYYRHIDIQKIQFDFLCYDEQPAYSDEIKNLGGKIFIITSRRKNLKRNRDELRLFFKEYSQEYVAVWENANSLSDIAPLVFAKKYGVTNRIIHAHNSKNMGGKITQLLHSINRLRIQRYANHFWACSQLAGEWMYPQSVLSTKNYQIIKNAIDLSKFAYNKDIRLKKRKELKIENCFVIGHVGRFHFQKNHQFLIDIFNEVHKNFDNSILLLIGQGEDEQIIREKVKSLGLLDYVKFLGARADTAELYQAMDIFVLPSHFEGLGLVLIEAQANGLPCYASDCIPKEAQVTSSCQYLSLNLSAEKWVDKIMSHENGRNPDAVKEIQNSNYDIQKNAKNLEAFFINGD